MDCVFCKIINNDIPSMTVYEDELVKVILDIHPDSPGHMLVISKKHYENILDLDPKLGEHIINVSKNIYQLLIKILKIDGLTLMQNNGLGQDIKHFHLHLKPRYHNILNITQEEIFNMIKNNPIE